MRIILLFLILVLFFSGCFENERYLRGQVFDLDADNNEIPIDNVGVSIHGVTWDISKRHGFYTIKLPENIQPGNEIFLSVDVDPKKKRILHPLNGKMYLPSEIDTEKVDIKLIAPDLIRTVLSFEFVEEVIKQEVTENARFLEEDRKSEYYYTDIEKSYELPDGFLKETMSKFIDKNKASQDKEIKKLVLLAERKFSEAAIIAIEDAYNIEAQYNSITLEKKKMENQLFDKFKQTGDIFYAGLMFDQALIFYKRTASLISEVGDPEKWAIINFHLGNTFLNLSRHAKSEQSVIYLSEAKSAYHESLEFYNEKPKSDMWYMLKNNLGNVYREEANLVSVDEEKKKHLDSAWNEYNELAIDDLKKSNFELWLLAQGNKWVVPMDKSNLSMSSESEYFLDETIEAYRKLIKECNDQCVGFEAFDKINENLSTALTKKSEYSSGNEKIELLNDAIGLAESQVNKHSNVTGSDLEAWARNGQKQAEAVWNLAKSMQGQGRINGLNRAMNLCDGVLSKIGKTTFPQAWADIHYQLGLILLDLSREENSIEKERKLNQALTSFRTSFEVYSKKDHPYDWSIAKNVEGYVLTLLGDTLHQEKYYLEAKESVKAALDVDSENPDFMDSMGWIEYRLKNLDAAENFVRKALKSYGKTLESTEITSHLIEVLWARGKKDEANSLLQDALAKNPDDEFLLDVKSKVVK